MELARELLLAIEAMPAGQQFGMFDAKAAFPECDEATVAAHVELLIDANLLDGKIRPVMGPVPVWHVTRITWAGHEFIASARDDTAWKKTIATVKEKGGSVTFDVLKTMLTTYLRAKMMGGHDAPAM